MSTERLIKENSQNIGIAPKETVKIFSDPQISNLYLNKVENITLKKRKSKICINILQEKLRKKEVKTRFENRIVFGLFISVVVVLFYISS